MTQKHNGGPAFPPFHNPKFHESGMTLRDYFAGQALAGIIANPENTDGEGGAFFSQAAYATADAMLAEREKGNNQ